MGEHFGLQYEPCTIEDVSNIGIKKVIVINFDSRKERLANVMQLLGYFRFLFPRYPAINAKRIYKQIDGLHLDTHYFRQLFSTVLKLVGRVVLGAWVNSPVNEKAPTVRLAVPMF